MACVVVVPARNEADRVVRALDALDAQRAAPRFEVLLLANNCDDGTAEVARRWVAGRGGTPVHVVEARIEEPDAHIGFVRRELMNEGARRLQRAGVDGFIASTDADSCVAPDWLAATAAEFARGADAVGGRIVVDDDPPADRDALRLRRVDEAHALLRRRVASMLDPDPADPWPNHHQHFGASLAVRAGAYEQVGGVPDVRFLEDDALVRALERADCTVRHSPLVRVRTSARLDGRADVGLSWQLRQWTERERSTPFDPLVESAAHHIAALSDRASARRRWRAERHEGAAGFGAWWSSADAVRLQALSEGGAFVPRSAAIADYRAWLRAAHARRELIAA